MWKSLSKSWGWLFATSWTIQSMDFSRQEYGSRSLSLLQGIFPTQKLNPGFQHCRWILYQLSHKGSPRILEWVAFPFSSGSSWPRNQIGVSCIAGGFFTNWASGKPQNYHRKLSNHKGKRLPGEALQIAVKRREAKSKGEKERYSHLKAEFQRIARRDKKAFLSDQCKETEENNRMGKTRDLFKKIRDTKGTFHAKMGSIKDRNGMDLTEEEVARIYRRTVQKRSSRPR